MQKTPSRATILLATRLAQTLSRHDLRRNATYWCWSSETLLVGDAGPEDERREDWEAAQAAGVTFEHANGHFATLDGVIPL